VTARTLSLFEGYGIEIEWMIVDRTSLDVRPIADVLLREAAGAADWVDDAPAGATEWSNELVAHVMEIKTAGPAPSFVGLAGHFEKSAKEMNRIAARHGARLAPGAMHPWMDPARETTIWPHSNARIYAAYDKLFDCRRHGWANLQSVHLNLPFANDAELARLLAAIRIVLPLIPALAASSPVVEGRATGSLDSRLHVYRTNSNRAPAMTGDVIPEPIFTREAYRRDVLDPIDRELLALGADDALLYQPFTNARGAIVRFDRMAIEIRLIDTQECPRADLAVAAAVSGLVRALVEERSCAHARQMSVPTETLVALLVDTIEHGPAAEIPSDFALLFGPSAQGARTAGALLASTAPKTFDGPAELLPSLEVVLREGTLAQRILRALGPDFDRSALERVVARLCECLEEGATFRP
jgi:gamma-glutamyl:cysteine ligase YbdK (ATP-grasp superfamily)